MVAVASRPSSPSQLLLAAAPQAAAGQAALAAPAAWAAVPGLGVGSADLAAGLPAAAAALGGVESLVLNVTPSTRDASLSFQAVVQARTAGLICFTRTCLLSPQSQA